MTLKSFCKSNKLSDKSLSEAYELYLKGGKNPLNRDDFEAELLNLNIGIAVKEAKACAAFATIHGRSSHEKYVRSNHYVSKKLWKLAMEKVQGDVEQQPEDIHQGSTDVLIEINEEETYKKLLPMNWTRMSFSDRVQFTRKVQHDGFFKYICKTDPKIDKYLGALKEGRHPGLNLYITLFSFPSKNYSDEAKALLKCFVDTLNMAGRSKLQYMECHEPDIVEIREVR